MARNANSRTFQLVLTSLMIALALVLNRIVPATPVYHLTLDFIPVFIVGVLFGPVWAAIAYGIADTIGSILIPFGAYNPGITLSLMLLGVVYGAVFFNKDCSGKKLFIRTFIAALLTFLIKLFITTLCLWPMFGADNTYWAYVLLRLPNCIPIAIANLILLPIVYKLVMKLK